LKDSHTLASYDGIKDGSIIFMLMWSDVSHGRYRVLVSIRTTDEKWEIINLDIFSYDTVPQVKQAIYEPTSIPTRKQRIVFAGKNLADDLVFSHYGICQGSTVPLIIRNVSCAANTSKSDEGDPTPPL
jgi:hypothetical protein